MSDLLLEIRLIMKKVMIAAVILVNLILVIFVALYVMGIFPTKEPVASDAATAETVQEKTTVFYPFEPPVVVNIQDGRKLRFMQVEFQLMARNQAAMEPIEKLEPLIRHEIIMLFSKVDGKSIRTLETKQQLQQDCLNLINSILEQEGYKPDIENIVFTKLIVQ